MGIEEMLLDQAYKKGYEEGLKIGFEEGFQKEILKGKKKAIERQKAEIVEKLIIKTQISNKQIADIVESPISFVQKIRRGNIKK